jgi:TetR/AcrR family transcriptional regulator
MAPRRQPPYTAVFAGLPAEKRERILAAARTIFARDGYAGTTVDEVAQAAGISVGALYKYFRTKERLFLTVIEAAHDVLDQVLGGIMAEGGTLGDKIERVLRAAVEFSEREPELVQIYIDCTTQQLSPIARRLSRQIELIGARTYRGMLEQARADGELEDGLDLDVATFCLDNLFLLMQFSYGSRYYRERLQVFTGRRSSEEVVRGVLAFIERALGLPASARAARGQSRAGRRRKT